MKTSIIRVYPPIWGFRRIQNFVAKGPIRGLSLYLGTVQLAVELRRALEEQK